MSVLRNSRRPWGKSLYVYLVLYQKPDHDGVSRSEWFSCGDYKCCMVDCITSLCYGSASFLASDSESPNVWQLLEIIWLQLRSIFFFLPEQVRLLFDSTPKARLQRSQYKCVSISMNKPSIETQAPFCAKIFRYSQESRGFHGHTGPGFRRGSWYVSG